VESDQSKAKRVKLTKSYIDGAAFEGTGPQTRDVRWDTEMKGLGIRIFPSGQKSFVLSYRINGRKRLMKLGDYGVKTLDEARRDARAKRVLVESGRDPLQERQDAHDEESVATLCADYLERYAKPFKKSWREDERLINRYLLPNWKSLKVTAIRKADVAALHHKVGKTSHYEANRAKSLISKMWECAREWGLIAEDAMNPSRGVESFPEVERKRYVREDELPKLAKSIEQEPNIYVRAAFWIFLFTGLRKSELLRAKWEHLNQAQSTLFIPETKSGEPQTMPLSPPAMEVLRQVPRQQGNPYIFAGHKKGTHLVGIHKNWDEIRARAGVPDLRIHDLRHTVGSWLAQSGRSLYLVGKVLNHADQSTSQRYAHLEQKQVREALDDHGREVMARAGLRIASSAEAEVEGGQGI